MATADHMKRISEDHLAELERQHGRIKHVHYNGHDLVFRKPKRVEVQQHRVKLHGDNPAEKAAADEFLAQLLIVHCDGRDGAESKPAFLELLEDYPYLVSNHDVGDAILRLTGIKQDEDAKSYGSISKPSDPPQKNLQTG